MGQRSERRGEEGEGEGMIGGERQLLILGSVQQIPRELCDDFLANVFIVGANSSCSLLGRCWSQWIKG